MSGIANKILILSNDGKVVSKDNSNVKIIPSQSEQNFINHGIDKSTTIDLNSQMTNKVFIEQSSTPLGSGKVFKKSIDTLVTPIKKVEIK